MTDQKKDLTRIEDLSEFIHDLNSEEEVIDYSSSESTFPEDLPDLPSNDEENLFDESSEIDFGSSDDVPPFETPAFEENTFEEGSLDFGSSSEEEETPFESSSFETSFDESEDPFAQSNDDDPFKETETPSFEAAEVAEPFALEETLAQEEPTPELAPEPVEEKIEDVSEPLPVYTPPVQEEYKAPENFDDLKKFSESSSFTTMAAEGNPSFSVLVKNIRYIEDVNDIMALLQEFNLLADSPDQTKNRLMRGNLLVPRISEYAAIFLAHKLRRFDVDIQLGPSDEIHPPKHQENPETGVVSRHSLYQNQSHSFHFDDPKLELSQIIVAATPALEGHQVVRYIGVASEHKMLDGNIVEDENSSEVSALYHELAQKLKAHALKNHANAVVGLNYQLTPLPSEIGMGGHKYRLTCTGNLVWVNKL